MKVTTRERSLLIVLPTAAVIAGYAWFAPAGLRSDVAAVEAARRKVTTLEQLEAARRRAGALQAEARDAERAIREARERFTSPASPRAEPRLLAAAPARVGAVTLLEQLARRHGVDVLETAPAPGAWVPPGLLRVHAPAASAPARGRTAPTPPAQQPQRVWRLRLAGSYAGVLALLRAVAADAAAPLPLALTMGPAVSARGAARTWTLEVWL